MQLFVVYLQHVEHDDSMEGSRVGERYSDAESLGDISGSSTQSNMLLSGDHMTSLSQLARSLHSIVVSNSVMLFYWDSG